MIGGVPASLPNFGSAYNPEAIIDHGSAFDLINGGGLDITILGLGECDQYGNVNVSKFGKKLIGPGGFIDITQSTNKVVFCGTFTGKSKLAVGDGKLTIVEEGTVKKFVDNVQQITFSGKYARPDQEVLYVTERCVFKLINGKMTIIEVAPGVSIEKDILPYMGFAPEIAPDVKRWIPPFSARSGASSGKVWTGNNLFLFTL